MTGAGMGAYRGGRIENFGKIMKRTKAQRRWIRKGYTREMIPLRPLYGARDRYSYVMRASEDWRSQRVFARDVLNMPVRAICRQFLHNGGKP